MTEASEKDSETVFNELLQDFTNCGSTTEEYLSAEAIASALKELQITDMEQLKDISCEQLFKEMIIEYVKLSFAFRYEEKIRMKKSPAETKKLLSEMNKYISNELVDSFRVEPHTLHFFARIIKRLQCTSVGSSALLLHLRMSHIEALPK